MTMRISVQIDSAAAQAQLRRWGGEWVKPCHECRAGHRAVSGVPEQAGPDGGGLAGMIEPARILAILKVYREHLDSAPQSP